MFTYFRHNYKLAPYKLDDVAGLYISNEIIRIIDYEEYVPFGALFLIAPT